MRSLTLFCLLIALTFSCQQGDVKQASDNSEKDAAVLENPFIHSVYFWFKEGTTQAQKDAFMADTKAFVEIETVKALYAGTPAPSEARPVVENSYDFSVIIHFEDLAGHDFYQEAPMHLEMIEKHSDIWEKVMVLDMQE